MIMTSSFFTLRTHGKHKRHIDVVAKLLLNHCPEESNETGRHMMNS